MLVKLTVENIALIHHLDLEFGSGLTILTGETGAGKSILIDALSLVLGSRSDNTLIRSGTERSSVQGCFLVPSNHPSLAWLKEKDLDADNGSELFLRRVLSTQGRSRAFINQIQVPVSILAELGTMLVEIHGQQDHQILLNPGNHLSILDDFADHDPLVKETKILYTSWRDIVNQLQVLHQHQADAADRKAFLSFQLKELQSAGVIVGEMGKLEEQRARLAHATRLSEASQSALDLLTEQGDSAATLSGRAAGHLESVVELDPSLQSIAETVRSLHYELEDVADRTRRYLEALEVDPVLLEEADERLNLLRGLARKHRREVDQLPDLEEQWHQELALLDSSEERELELEQALTKAYNSYEVIAKQLGESRKKAALSLNQTVEDQLQGMHMVNARFSATVKTRTGDPHVHGMETTLFQVSTNPGEPLKPLHQVASGGELSRITLAIRTALAHSLIVPTLVFDEVDVGVGGRVADSIGAKMARIAQKRQVLSITHLPQVAAWGDNHLMVEKKTRDGKTTVTITPLRANNREEELARMLAGDKITDQARDHAKALLESCHLSE